MLKKTQISFVEVKILKEINCFIKEFQVEDIQKEQNWLMNLNKTSELKTNIISIAYLL